MQQFNDLLRDILDNGRWSGNRTGNPTKKVFGRQLRFNLAEGFPLVTGRKIYLKGLLKELIWFRDGKTNSKDLENEKVAIWRQWALTEEDIATTVPEDDERAIEFKATHQRFPTYADLGYRVGDLGPVYGKQWVAWDCADGRTINQLKEVEWLLKNKPMSRRIIVSAWNPEDLPDESKSPRQNVLDDKMALAACHTMFQFFVDEATVEERLQHYRKRYSNPDDNVKDVIDLDGIGVPKLRLSCQLYQR